MRLGAQHASARQPHLIAAQFAALPKFNTLELVGRFNQIEII
jgi:hypothetical protein